MDISVIVPVYNRRELISRALDSVVRQLAQPTEIIVIDDGSTDGTAELINRHYPQVKLRQQPNLGVSAARNHGIRLARSSWIAFLDSDDEWIENKLQRQVTMLERNPEELCGDRNPANKG